MKTVFLVISLCLVGSISGCQGNAQASTWNEDIKKRYWTEGLVTDTVKGQIIKHSHQIDLTLPDYIDAPTTKITCNDCVLPTSKEEMKVYVGR